MCLDSIRIDPPGRLIVRVCSSDRWGRALGCVSQSAEQGVRVVSVVDHVRCVEGGG